MRIKTLCYFGLVIQCSQLKTQDSSSFPTIGEIVRIDPQLDEIVVSDSRIEVLASGFDWSEGPVWVPREGGYLLFSDVPQNTIFKWQAGKGISMFMKPSGFTGVGVYSSEPGSNGLALDADGRLICCEHGDRRLSVMSWGQGKRTLADNWQGKWFNSPNDVVCRSNGDMYFTDPPYGLPNREYDEVHGYGGNGVFRIAESGEVTLLTKEMTRPNGIVLSPDEKTLYVAQSDSAAPIIRAFDINVEGAVSNSRVFYDASSEFGKRKGSPDGMTIDAQGNLFATGPGGVHVISPDGKLLGRIDTNEAASNCCWGDDGSVLYITSDMYLCRVRTKTKGLGW